MAHSLTESQPVLRERCKAAGLPEAHIRRLEEQQLTSLSKLGYAAGQPGETPTHDKLKQLVQIGSDAVPVHVLASIRQVVFEAQTLLISQVRAMLEKKDDDAKTELAPAERASRIRDQESRMKGLTLQGEAMCSHGSYDIVVKVVEQNTLSYLSPSKFASRQSELRLEKPKKTLEISSGSTGHS